jgi:hypothetical protein
VGGGAPLGLSLGGDGGREEGKGGASLGLGVGGEGVVTHEGKGATRLSLRKRSERETLS